MEHIQLLRIIKILSTLLDKEVNKYVAQYNLTSSQCMVLFYLFSNKDKELSPIDLEKRFNLSHPTVLGILKRLKEKGFIDINKSKIDSRYRIISLNQKGLDRENKITSLIEELNKTLESKLNQTDLIIVKNNLNSLINYLKENKE